MRARALLILWIPAALLICAYLLGGHLLTLPKPSNADPRLAGAIALSRGPDSTNRWLALHVLYEDCRCSQRVLDHLIARKAGPFAVERVILVAGHSGKAERVTAAGFQFENITPDELERRYGILAAPIMVIADPTNVVRYIGGYTNRKQSPIVRDEQILSELSAGKTPTALPLFGCAVSKDLDRTIDPLGLR